MGFARRRLETHGQAERRTDLNPFHSRRRDVGPTVALFVDRCIMCTRCVRFTREISGTAALIAASIVSHNGTTLPSNNSR